MARKKRHESRTQEPRQTSGPLLNLPLEIRSLIYAAALTEPTPIELSPFTWLTPEQKEDTPAVAARVAKWTAERKLLNRPRFDSTRTLEFLHIKDLEYVRSEMAPALLRTCSQVYNEAWPCWWRDNTWRFSNDETAMGHLRRFLITIGPRARSQIRTLEFLLKDELPDDAGMALVVQDSHLATPRPQPPRVPMEYKHHPKLRMRKNTGDDFHGDRDWVFDLLKREKPTLLRDLRFYVRDGAVVSEQALRGLCSAYGWRNISTAPFYANFWRWGRLSWLNRVVVLEKGAKLEGLSFVELLNHKGIGVVCEKGSIATPPGGTRGSSDHEEMQVDTYFPGCDPSDDFLYALSELFEPPWEVSGAWGTRTARSKPIRPRALKGFGGCRFERAEGWYCRKCGGKPSKQGPANKGPYGWGHPPGGTCPRPNGTWAGANECNWVMLEGIVLKKHERALRQGITTEHIRGSRLQW